MYINKQKKKAFTGNDIESKTQHEVSLTGSNAFSMRKSKTKDLKGISLLLASKVITLPAYQAEFSSRSSLLQRGLDRNSLCEKKEVH